jgi:hypothetical protein
MRAVLLQAICKVRYTAGYALKLRVSKSLPETFIW